MFVTNKYKRIYDDLCSRAKTRTVAGYTEKHHVIPKSLGAPNTSDNIVRLTAREHYVAHRCLMHCTTGKARYRMISAVKYFAMGRTKGPIAACRSLRINSRTIDALRQAHAEMASYSLLGHAPTGPAHHSVETRAKIRSRMVGNRNSPGWPKGKPRKPILLNNGSHETAVLS